MKRIALLLLLAFLGSAVGCEPQPSLMARLDLESLGLIVEAEASDLEPIVTVYVQNKLPEVKIIGSQAIWAHLGRPAVPSCLSVLENPETLTALRKELGIQYLAVISIEPGEAPRHTASFTVGTDKSEVRLTQYVTVNLEYMVIDTGSGEQVYTGQAAGKSSDVADLKVGTQGTQVGIQLTKDSSLLKEAVRNALKETGLF
ncbi:MAG: hypothetical protein GX341_03595 [Firmicutes bacterium]|jgi:hypothetical protein|nr:hypothetical protein [Bacillota bacterium]